MGMDIGGSGQHPESQDVSKEQFEAAGQRGAKKLQKAQEEKKTSDQTKLQKVMSWSSNQAATSALEEGLQHLKENQEKPELNDEQKEAKDADDPSKGSDGAAKSAGGSKAAKKSEKEKKKQPLKKGGEVHKMFGATRPPSSKKMKETKEKALHDAEDDVGAKFVKGEKTAKESKAKQTLPTEKEKQSSETENDSNHAKLSSKTQNASSTQRQANTQTKDAKSEHAEGSDQSRSSSTQQTKHEEAKASLSRNLQSRATQAKEDAKQTKSQKSESERLPSHQVHSSSGKHTHVESKQHIVKEKAQPESQSKVKESSQQKEPHASTSKPESHLSQSTPTPKEQSKAQTQSKAQESSQQPPAQQSSSDKATSGAQSQVASQVKNKSSKQENDEVKSTTKSGSPKGTDLKASQVVQDASSGGNADDHSGEGDKRGQSQAIHLQQLQEKAPAHSNEPTTEKEGPEDSTGVDELTASEMAEAKKAKKKDTSKIRKSAKKKKASGSSTQETSDEEYEPHQIEASIAKLPSELQEIGASRGNSVLAARQSVSLFNDPNIIPDHLKEPSPTESFEDFDGGGGILGGGGGFGPIEGPITQPTKPPIAHSHYNPGAHNPFIGSIPGGVHLPKFDPLTHALSPPPPPKPDPKPGDVKPDVETVTLFSHKYHLKIENTLDDEADATMASYQFRHESGKIAAHRNKLEIEARKYASYVSNYMSDVRGYIFHAFRGNYHFTNDLTMQKKTPEYSEWLNNINKYQDDYIAAKDSLDNFEGVYTGAKASYTLAYDQTEMYIKLKDQVDTSIKGIDYQKYHSEIVHLEGEQEGLRTNIYNYLSHIGGELESEYQSLLSQSRSGKNASEYGAAASVVGEASNEFASLRSEIEDKLDTGKSFSTSGINALLGEVEGKLNSNSIASRDGATILSNLSDLSTNVNDCAGLAGQIQSIKDTIKSKIQGFFNSAKGYLNSQRDKIVAQSEAYGSTLTTKTSQGTSNPFSTVLNSLQHIDNALDREDQATSLSQMWSNAQKVKSTMNTIVEKVCTPSAMARFHSDLSAWKSAQVGIVQMRNDFNAAKATYDANKKCPVPIGHRFKGFSAYGRAMDNLQDYKRVLANLSALSPQFDEFSQLASRPPRKVNPHTMVEDWETYLRFKAQVHPTQIKLDVTYGLLAGAVAWAASCCGINPVADAAIAACTIEIVMLKKKMYDLKHIEIPGAYNSYMGDVNTLKAMQIHKDEIWKQKMDVKSEAVAQQIDKDLQQSTRKRNQATKGMEREESNMQRLEKTALKIASHNRKAAQTHSFT